MAKDNHLALLGTGSELTAALRKARASLGHTVHFEVEIDSLDQLDAVLAAGVDTIMLDNFSLADWPPGCAGSPAPRWWRPRATSSWRPWQPSPPPGSTSFPPAP